MLRGATAAAIAALVAGSGAARRCGGGTTAAPATSGATPIKVGLITDLGQLNDNGFNELAYNGLKRAERRLGIQGRVVESKSAADYVPNMATLARQGYDLIIGVGYAQGNAIATAAKAFPNTNFAIVDVDQTTLKGKPKNVRGLLFREQEVGYLAGYLGALEAKRAGGDADQRGRRATRSRRSTGTSRATRRARRRPCPGTDGQVGLLAGLGRPGEVQGARAQPDRRPARRSSSRSRAAAASARSSRRSSRGSGASASTPTSRSSARTC